MANINCPVCKQLIDQVESRCPNCQADLLGYYNRLKKGEAALKIARDAKEQGDLRGARQWYISALEIVPENDAVLEELTALNKTLVGEKVETPKKRSWVRYVVGLIGLFFLGVVIGYFLWPDGQIAFQKAPVKELDPIKVHLEELFQAYLKGDYTAFVDDPVAIKALFGKLDEKDQKAKGYLLTWASWQLTEAGCNSTGEESVKYLETALILCPDCFMIDDATFYLAEKLKAEDPERAYALYEQILGLERGSWYFDNALLGIADIHALKGEEELAKQKYQEVIDLYPRTDGAERAQLILNSLQ